MAKKRKISQRMNRILFLAMYFVAWLLEKEWPADDQEHEYI